MNTRMLALALIAFGTTAGAWEMPQQPATGAPAIVAPNGKYLGDLSANPYAPNSVSNPYGRYGSPYSPDSINNPYGRYGSRFSPDSPNNPYATGGRIRWGR